MSTDCLMRLKNTTGKGTVMKNKSNLKEIKDEKIYTNDETNIEKRMIPVKIGNKKTEERAIGKNVNIFN